MKLLLATVIFAIGWLALTAPTYDQLYQPWALMGELVALAVGIAVLVVGVFAAVYERGPQWLRWHEGDITLLLMAVGILLLWVFHVDAAELKQKFRFSGTVPVLTQGDCIAAYLAVCGSVPLEETAVRACITSHRFNSQCLELVKGIK
jgi:hypothetical protein